MRARWPRAGLVVVLALSLADCGHSSPAAVDPDRWVGPWAEGPPVQLFPGPVALVNFSADGEGILFTRHDRERPHMPRVPARRDTSETALGYLPIGGGSGVWSHFDTRPSQRDSLNNMITAAYRPGSLLVEEETGPIGHDVNRLDWPVLWHIELYQLDPRDQGHRRKLLDLFDEVGGHAVVPDGTLNWFFSLQWAGDDRFVGEGGHLRVKPGEPIERLGLFAGTIGDGTTTLERLDDLAGVDRWSVTDDGQVLLQSGHDLALLGFAGRGRQSLGTIPGGPERIVMTSRCDLATCWAIGRDRSVASADWEIWRIDRSTGVPELVRTVGPSPSGVPLLPPSGADVIVQFQGIPYRIAGVLSTP